MRILFFEQVLRQKAYAVCAASQDALAKLDNVGGERHNFGAPVACRDETGRGYDVHFAARHAKRKDWLFVLRANMFGASQSQGNLERSRAC